MIVFSMLLMLCGQTLASTLMWCCLAGAVAEATPPQSHELKRHELMLHEDMQQHDHGHALSGVDTEVAVVSPPPHHAVQDVPPALASLLDCEHSCTSSCSNTAVLAAVISPQSLIAFAPEWPSIPSALPQTDLPLPFRPPITA